MPIDFDFIHLNSLINQATGNTHLSTNNAVYTFQALITRSIDIQKDKFFYFVD